MCHIYFYSNKLVLFFCLLFILQNNTDLLKEGKVTLINCRHSLRQFLSAPYRNAIAKCVLYNSFAYIFFYFEIFQKVATISEKRTHAFSTRFIWGVCARLRLARCPSSARFSPLIHRNSNRRAILFFSSFHVNCRLILPSCIFKRSNFIDCFVRRRCLFWEGNLGNRLTLGMCLN